MLLWHRLLLPAISPLNSSWEVVCVNLDDPKGADISMWELKSASISQGAFGAVFEIPNNKVVKKSVFKDGLDHEFYFKEYEYALGLSSIPGQGVVKVFDCAYSSNTFYFSQEKLYGSIVNDLAETFRKLRMINRLERLSDVLLTLIYIHKKGIVHCDIKPDNLMSIDGKISKIIIIDFGLAFDHSDRRKAGTPFYWSPSFLFDYRPNNIADDYWALLMSFFEIEFELDYLSDYNQCVDYTKDSEGMPTMQAESEKNRSRADKCTELLRIGIENSFDDKRDDLEYDCGPEAFNEYKNFFQRMSDPSFFTWTDISEQLVNSMSKVIDECKGHIYLVKTGERVVTRMPRTERKRAAFKFAQQAKKSAKIPSIDLHLENMTSLDMNLENKTSFGMNLENNNPMKKVRIVKDQNTEKHIMDDYDVVERKNLATKKFVDSRLDLFVREKMTHHLLPEEVSQDNTPSNRFMISIDFTLPPKENIGLKGKQPANYSLI